MLFLKTLFRPRHQVTLRIKLAVRIKAIIMPKDMKLAEFPEDAALLNDKIKNGTNISKARTSVLMIMVDMFSALIT